MKTSILAGGVDHVVVFSDPTVDRLLRLLKPDAHREGPDYTSNPSRNEESWKRTAAGR